MRGFFEALQFGGGGRTLLGVPLLEHRGPRSTAVKRLLGFLFSALG